MPLHIAENLYEYYLLEEGEPEEVLVDQDTSTNVPEEIKEPEDETPEEQANSLSPQERNRIKNINQDTEKAMDRDIEDFKIGRAHV